MSELTFSNKRCQCPPHLQRRQERKTPKNKALSSHSSADLSAPSSSWKVIAVISGIICLALLAAVGFLAIKLNKKLFNAEGHPGTISYNKEGNKAVWKYPPCKSNWHQRGGNCYFLSKTKQVWNQCPSYCTGLNSSFLKADTEEEMNFVMQLSKLQCDMRKEKLFISLFYNSKQLKWTWLDGANFTLSKLQILGHKPGDNKCIHIKSGRLNAEDCQIDGYCICQKTI